MSLDIDVFISEIEKRPAIYNTKLKEYSDKNLKKKLWIELCEKFIDSWSELEVAEKDKRGEELQRKWKNLRTCFKREYDAQKHEPSGSGATKRRKYLYYDQLLFLRDSVEARQTSSNLDTIVNNENIEENVDEEPQAMTRPKTTKRRRAPETSYEESLLQLLREKKDEDREIDEDKYFLLSLLPSFKKFNEDQKFVAKTEIMSVIRRIRLSGGHQAGLEQQNTAHYYSTFAGQHCSQNLVCVPTVVSASSQEAWEGASDISSVMSLI